MSALVVGEYDRAIDLWTTQVKELEENTMLAVLGTLPMAERPVDPPLFGRVQENWVPRRIGGWVGLGRAVPHVVDRPLFDAALSDLELGRSKAAAKRLKQLLKISPESEFRPLAALYIGQTTGENVDVLPPSAFVPTWTACSPPAPPSHEAKTPQSEETPKAGRNRKGAAPEVSEAK